MLDSHRRRQLSRLVLDNDISVEDCAFMVNATALVEEAKPLPPLVLEPTLGEKLAYAEKELCRLEKKIPAIKSVRERTNLGLKEAKDLVDEYCRTEEHRRRVRDGY